MTSPRDELHARHLFKAYSDCQGDARAEIRSRGTACSFLLFVILIRINIKGIEAASPRWRRAASPIGKPGGIHLKASKILPCLVCLLTLQACVATSVLDTRLPSSESINLSPLIRQASVSAGALGLSSRVLDSKLLPDEIQAKAATTMPLGPDRPLLESAEQLEYAVANILYGIGLNPTNPIRGAKDLMEIPDGDFINSKISDYLEVYGVAVAPLLEIQARATEKVLLRESLRGFHADCVKALANGVRNILVADISLTLTKACTWPRNGNRSAEEQRVLDQAVLVRTLELLIIRSSEISAEIVRTLESGEVNFAKTYSRQISDVRKKLNLPTEGRAASTPEAGDARSQLEYLLDPLFIAMKQVEPYFARSILIRAQLVKASVDRAKQITAPLPPSVSQYLRGVAGKVQADMKNSRLARTCLKTSEIENRIDTQFLAEYARTRLSLMNQVSSFLPSSHSIYRSYNISELQLEVSEEKGTHLRTPLKIEKKRPVIVLGTKEIRGLCGTLFNEKVAEAFKLADKFVGDIDELAKAGILRPDIGFGWDTIRSALESFGMVGAAEQQFAEAIDFLIAHEAGHWHFDFHPGETGVTTKAEQELRADLFAIVVVNSIHPSAFLSRASTSLDDVPATWANQQSGNVLSIAESSLLNAMPGATALMSVLKGADYEAAISTRSHPPKDIRLAQIMESLRALPVLPRKS
jgi:hypothetical protein